MTQAVQLFVQKRIISNVLSMTEAPRAPFFLTMLNRFPFLRRIPARLIGMGFRPEHVSSEIRDQKSEVRNKKSEVGGEK